MSRKQRTISLSASKPLTRPARRLSAKRGEALAAWCMLLPSLLGISIFFLIPFADTVRRSFTNTSGSTFTGFASYLSVFQNEAFLKAAGNTARFIGVCIPLLLALSLALALLVRAAKGGGARFKTFYLLPMAVPAASVVLLWKVLFGANGLANTLMEGLGLPHLDLMTSNAAFWVLIFTYLWKNAGYDMILWLAGLDAIPGSRYEAARVDGANTLQCFAHITLPGIAPTLGLVAILSLLNSFKVFREAWSVLGSYPHDSIYLLQNLFNNWFQNMDVSRLCAAATLLCIALLIILLAVQGIFKEDDT